MSKNNIPDHWELAAAANELAAAREERVRSGVGFGEEAEVQPLPRSPGEQAGCHARGLGGGPGRRQKPGRAERAAGEPGRRAAGDRTPPPGLLVLCYMEKGSTRKLKALLGSTAPEDAAAAVRLIREKKSAMTKRARLSRRGRLKAIKKRAAARE